MPIARRSIAGSSRRWWRRARPRRCASGEERASDEGGGALVGGARCRTIELLCELAEGEGYEEIPPDTVVVTTGAFDVRVLGLERLIAVKARAGRLEDKAVLPVLIAMLEHQKGPTQP